MFFQCNGSIVLTADRHAYTEPSRQESNYPHYLLGKEVGFSII